MVLHPAQPRRSSHGGSVSASRCSQVWVAAVSHVCCGLAASSRLRTFSPPAVKIVSRPLAGATTSPLRSPAARQQPTRLFENERTRATSVRLSLLDAGRLPMLAAMCTLGRIRAPTSQMNKSDDVSQSPLLSSSSAMPVSPPRKLTPIERQCSCLHAQNDARTYWQQRRANIAARRIGNAHLLLS